jgi:hypothetical protein
MSQPKFKTSGARLVGNDSAAPYCCFGDDSACGNTLVYAFANFYRRRVSAAEKRLRYVKKRFRIPEGTTIHCRQMFNGMAREKAGLGHLNQLSVQSLVAHLITEMNELSFMVRFSYCDFAEAEAAFTNETNTDAPIKVYPEKKGILAMLMQACFAVEADGKAPLPHDSEIFAAADSTKIRFAGDQRRQAHNLYSGFGDLGDPSNLYRLEPRIVEAHEQPLSQVADVVAYVCSHAVASGTQHSFFTQQLQRIKYRSWSQIHLGTPPEVLKS